MTGGRIPNPAPSEIGAVFLGIRRHDLVDHWAGHGPTSDETSFTVVCRVDSIIGRDLSIFERLSIAVRFWAVPGPNG